jgi:hypothetical protein
MKTEHNYYKAEFWNDHHQKWLPCLYWDGGTYNDTEGNTIDELFVNLERDHGLKEDLMDALYNGRFRIFKVQEIIEYSQEEVQFPLTTT